MKHSAKIMPLAMVLSVTTAMVPQALAQTPPGAPPALSPVWYEYEGPDTKWGAPGKVCFVPENSKITGDGLVQTAMAPSGGFACGLQNMPYTTSQIKWSKFNFTYGVVEYRAKFAGGVGTHPAIWMLGSDCQPSAGRGIADGGPKCNWPRSGSNEIDITEIKHGDFTHPWQNVCNPEGNPYGTWTTFQYAMSDVTKDFHDYKFVWSPTSLTWYVDGAKTHEVVWDPASRTTYIDGVQDPNHLQMSYIPSTPMFILISLFVGYKSRPAAEIDPRTFPQSNVVQYLRVCPLGTEKCDAKHATYFDEEFNQLSWRLPE